MCRAVSLFLFLPMLLLFPHIVSFSSSLLFPACSSRLTKTRSESYTSPSRRWSCRRVSLSPILQRTAKPDCGAHFSFLFFYTVILSFLTEFSLLPASSNLLHLPARLPAAWTNAWPGWAGIKMALKQDILRLAVLAPCVLRPAPVLFWRRAYFGGGQSGNRHPISRLRRYARCDVHCTSTYVHMYIINT